MASLNGMTHLEQPIFGFRVFFYCSSSNRAESFLLLSTLCWESKQCTSARKMQRRRAGRLTFRWCKFSILPMMLFCKYKICKLRQTLPITSIFSMHCWCRVISFKLDRTPSLCSALCQETYQINALIIKLSKKEIHSIRNVSADHQASQRGNLLYNNCMRYCGPSSFPKKKSPWLLVWKVLLFSIKRLWSVPSSARSSST